MIDAAHMPAVHLPPPHVANPYAVHSPAPQGDTICVSGYPPIPSFTLKNALGEPLAKIGGDGACELARKWTVKAPEPPPTPLARCGGCNGPLRPTMTTDQRLGMPLCPGCAEEHGAACVAAHGRLPDVEAQFYCLGCGAIRAKAECSKPDADGRRRWRCQPCRRQQVWRAERRRQAKKRSWG